MSGPHRGSARPGNHRAAEISIKCRRKVAPEPAHHSLGMRFRRSGLSEVSGPPPNAPPDRQLSSVPSHGPEPVIQAPVRNVAPKLRLPAIRWVELDRGAIPLPAFVRLRQILEHDPASVPGDDLSLPVTSVEQRVLRRVIGEPSVHERQGSPEDGSNFVERGRPGAHEGLRPRRAKNCGGDNTCIETTQDRVASPVLRLLMDPEDVPTGSAFSRADGRFGRVTGTGSSKATLERSGARRRPRTESRARSTHRPPLGKLGEDPTPANRAIGRSSSPPRSRRPD